jgi:hypothetical protein
LRSISCAEDKTPLYCNEVGPGQYNINKGLTFGSMAVLDKFYNMPAFSFPK